MSLPVHRAPPRSCVVVQDQNAGKEPEARVCAGARRAGFAQSRGCFAELEGWQSEAGGGWEAEVRVMNFRNRYPEFSGRNLSFWCFAPQAIAAADMPSLVLSTAREGLQVAEFPASFTEPLALGKITGDVPRGRWLLVRVQGLRPACGSELETG